MEIREETLDIFKSSFGAEAAYKVMEYIDSRVRDDVAIRKDIYELKLEIEKVRAEIKTIEANLHTEIKTLDVNLRTEIKTVEANLRTDIEKIRSELRVEIEKVRTETQKSHASLLKWSFAFWFSQVALLAGILFKLLS